MKSIALVLLASALTAGAVKPIVKTVEIPAGEFLMGSDGAGENFDEAPRHRVVIPRPFRMGVTEVTNRQYEQFRPEHKALRGKNNVSLGDDEAVVNVSYHDALAFCRWLSQREGKTYRLPTEAEWEYACRAGTDSPYFTGDTLPPEICRNQTIARDYNPVSLAVGKTAANAFGLRDMHGNVEEWCLDWYGPYSPASQTNPTGAKSGIYRVTRGGSHHTPVEFLRSANRSAMLPDDRHSLTGFRVVQAEFPETTADTAFFMEPIPFVAEPVMKNVPFYSHNHQPAIAACDNGDLLAIWFSASHENGRGMVVLSSRLRPGENQWRPAELFFSVPDRNVTGSSLLNLGNGRLLHLNGVEAAGDWQNLMMVSRTSSDNGLTWTTPRIVEPEHARRHQIIQGPSILSDGTIIQAADAGPAGNDGTSLHVSRDGGETWTDQWDGAPIPEFTHGGQGTTIAGIHAGVVALSNGTLMALGRGNALTDSRGRKRMPMSLSADTGRTWTYHASEFPPIDSGQRLVLLRLHEGPIMLISFAAGEEAAANAGEGMFAALSYDEGRTWPVRKLISDGKTRRLSGGAWTGDFTMDATHAEPKGYLTATQGPDGTIHLLSSRMHYRFNLQWLEKK